jgi:hypothetical protein
MVTATTFRALLLCATSWSCSCAPLKIAPSHRRALNFVEDFGEDLFGNIGDFFSDDVSDLIVDGIGGWFENAGIDSFAFFEEQGISMGDWMEVAASDTVGWVSDDFANFISMVGEAAIDWTANDFATFFTSDIADFFAEDVGGFVEDVGTAIGDVIVDDIGGVVVDVGEGIGDIVIDDIGGGVVDVVDGIDDGFEEIIGGFAEIDAAAINSLLHFAIANASSALTSKSFENDVTGKLNEVLRFLRDTDLGGLSVADVASTTSDLIGMVDAFSKGDGPAEAPVGERDSDIGVLITLIAAEVAEVLPIDTTVFGASNNVAVFLTSTDAQAPKTIDIAAVAANTSGTVVGAAANAEGGAIDPSKYAGISMTLPSYAKFNLAGKNGTEAGDADTKNNSVGVTCAVFSDSSTLYNSANAKSQVLSIKFGTQSKVGTNFSDGEVVKFSLSVTQDEGLNH